MTDPVQVGIVEDEAIIAMALTALLEKCGYTVAFTATSYAEAHTCLQTARPQVMLVDIRLNGERSGIDLAQDLYNTLRIPVIFLTANADTFTVQQAKKAHPAGYLVKPFSEESLYAAIEVALHNHVLLPETIETEQPLQVLKDNPSSNQFEETFFVRQGASVYKVPYAAILYAQSEDIYLYLHTIDRKYTLRMSLTALQEHLGSNRFIRVHKSYLVNGLHLDAINGETVLIKGQRLPLGRTYKADLLKQLPLL